MFDAHARRRKALFGKFWARLQAKLTIPNVSLNSSGVAAGVRSCARLFLSLTLDVSTVRHCTVIFACHLGTTLQTAPHK